MKLKMLFAVRFDSKWWNIGCSDNDQFTNEQHWFWITRYASQFGGWSV